MVLQYYSDRLRCRLTMDDEFLIEEFEDGQWKPVVRFNQRYKADSFARKYLVYTMKGWV